MIAWTFSMNSLVRVFLSVSSALGFRSTTSRGSSNALSCALKRLNRPDLHFEGAGKWSCYHNLIGREHELYSGASPISLVEHCVIFRHYRRLLSLLGFVQNWPTSRWSATTTKKKKKKKKKKEKEKENRFSLNGNGIMSSFLGRQFYRSTLYDRFWIVHILYVRMVNFKLLAQYPVDHFAYPVVSSLLLFLC